MHNVHTREAHTETGTENPGKMTGSVKQSGETGHPTFSWLLKHPRV